MQDKFKVDDIVELTKSFTLDDVKHFAELCGDINPIHIDPSFAENSIFGRPIVHGMLVASLFSAIIANNMPGPGSIYLHQSLDFKSPVFHDQIVVASVRVILIREDKPIYELETLCKDLDDKLLISGKAIVLKK